MSMPDFVAPMLARLSTPPAGAEGEDCGWAFEVKWDGVRAIARCREGELALRSRNGNDITAAYPELAGLAQALGSHEALLDGEIVAFDESGRPSFAALQPRIHLRGEAATGPRARAVPVTYAIFDLLWLDGESLMDLPYSDRRARLQELDLGGEHWRVSSYQRGGGEALLAATREQGLEGVIAKRLDSRYLSANRTGAWLKIKHHQSQEVVIGGWHEGKGARAGRIGALHIGVQDEHGLRYAGRVGTGFTQATLARLGALLAERAREDSPFAGPQPPRGAHFVTPDLVCEVEFSEWTKDGMLRHPSYKGLREDRPAAAVVREQPQAPPEPAAPSEAEPDRPPAIQRLIDAGRPVKDGIEIEIEGRTLKLTNLAKALYPRSGFTKRDLIAYYAQIAPALLPHLRGRPLTLKRYPDGVEGKSFYEKHTPAHRPEWVATTPIWSGQAGRTVEYCLCEDLSTLVWLANLAAIELHPSLSRAGVLDRPTTLAFDLDPGAPASIVQCCEVALLLHELFAELGLRAFAKSSGSKGLQVYVPLNQADVTYAQTKPFAHAVAQLLESRRPELVVSRMAKAGRRAKVLIDWSQNDEHKTTVAVYSLRAREAPTVSAPLTWEEVRGCAASGDPEALRLHAAQVLARARGGGDLFAGVLSLRQPLPALSGYS
jgi:bifunctional non-homologous end joining protein LigD